MLEKIVLETSLAKMYSSCKQRCSSGHLQGALLSWNSMRMDLQPTNQPPLSALAVVLFQPESLRKLLDL